MRWLASRVLTTLLVVLATAPALAGEPRHYPRGGPPAPSGPWLEQGAFRVQLGMFSPSGDSEFWRDTEAVFTGDAGDLDGVQYGADVLWSVNRHMSLMFSFSYAGGSTTQYYDEPLLSDLGHTTELSVMPMTAALVFFPAGRNSVLNPYLGVGGGVYWWDYSESGYFWDFVNEEETFQTYATDSEAFGFFLLAGLDIPVRPTWSFFVEGRWQEVNDDMADDFAGLGEADLSGFSLSGGFSWKF